MSKLEISLVEVKRRYELIMARMRGKTKGPIDPEERNLVMKYSGVDLHGWLLSEVERLRAFAVNANKHSTCPGTVLVAKQVLDGWDVRTVKDGFTPLAGIKDPEHGQPAR